MIEENCTVQDASTFKGAATEIFRRAGFQLHKWHSDVPKLEIEELQGAEDSVNFARQQLGIKT